MSALLAAVAAAVALGVLVISGAIAVRLSRVEGPSNDSAAIAEVAALRAEIAEIRTRTESLPSLWEHERALAEAAKDEATKQHRKAAAQRRVAERIAAGGEGVEDEPDTAAEFLQEHAESVDRQGVLPLRADVARTVEQDLTERARAVGWSPFL